MEREELLRKRWLSVRAAWPKRSRRPSSGWGTSNVDVAQQTMLRLVGLIGFFASSRPPGSRTTSTEPSRWSPRCR